MAEEVKLPQLGESVEEGVVIEWLVEVGDTVDVDQPLLEISTDKIDTEIPSPVAGVLTEIRADVDDTIEVGQVIAIIDPDGSASTPSSGDTDSAGEDQAADTAGEAADDGADEEAADDGADGAPAEEPAPRPGDTAPTPRSTPEPAPAAAADVDNSGALVSPLVRKLLREAGVDASRIQGTGVGGRVTREDAERAIATSGAAVGAPAAGGTGRVQAVPAAPTSERPEASPTQIDFGGQTEVTQKLSRIRKTIAKAMQHSLESTAQLTAAVEVDMTRIMTLRARVKDDFKAREGASLSPLPIIARATMLTIPRHPSVNSTMNLDEGTATWYRHINLGMAVDTPNGLIVPNIKDAQDLTIAGLARAIADLAKKARGKGLQLPDLQKGTFTITNTGSRGTLFDTPILNAPEAAILATCAIEKRPVVITDEFGQDQIAIRWMTYLCMTYDHRQLDGADAARFLQDLKWVLENHDFTAEVTA